jgi:hypothetical protein
MTGIDVCKLYTAMNNHFFSKNYNYFAYHGTVQLKQETYDKKRQDEQYRYERLGKKFRTKEELENFILANLINVKRRLWVGMLFGGDADEVYLRWQGRIQAPQYNLTSELKRVLDGKDSFNGLFQCEAGKHPDILRGLMRGDMSLESFVFLEICIGFIANLDPKLGDDRNWMIVRDKTLKYRPFLERLNIPVSSLRKAISTAIKETGVHG